jgi:hypothetical protein
MKKFGFLALLSIFLALPAMGQTSGQFTITVAGFAPVGTCQPGPSPAFTACPLPTPSLGVSYTAILPTVGLTGPVTCSVTSGSLPTGMTLKTNAATNTSCELDWPSPSATGASSFTIGVTG